MTDLASSRIVATSSGVYACTDRAAWAVLGDPAVVCDPTPPKRTFAKERFIALRIITASMKPGEPSSAAPTIRTLVLRTKPSAAAEIPAYEVRIAMTAGIAAPPIAATRSRQKR